MHSAVAAKLLPGDRLRFRVGDVSVDGDVVRVGKHYVRVNWSDGEANVPLNSPAWENIAMLDQTPDGMNLTRVEMLGGKPVRCFIEDKP